MSEITEPAGNILSPNYEPDNTGTYINDANCKWHIQVDPEYWIQLSFIEFEVEEG